MNNRITRSRINRVFGGVAGGLAKYLQIDIIIIRILFVVSVFFSGIGILLYLIMWIVIPEEPFFTENKEYFSDEGISENEINFTIHSNNNNSKKALGIILVVVGFLFLSTKFFSFIDFEDFFPIMLIGFGIYLLIKVKK